MARNGETTRPDAPAATCPHLPRGAIVCRHVRHAYQLTHLGRNWARNARAVYTSSTSRLRLGASSLVGFFPQTRYALPKDIAGLSELVVPVHTVRIILQGQVVAAVVLGPRN